MPVLVGEALAIVVIGDGVVGFLFPARHAARWLHGPELWRRGMRIFVDRPALTRAISLGEVGIGVWCAARLPAPR